MKNTAFNLFCNMMEKLQRFTNLINQPTVVTAICKMFLHNTELPI